MLVGHVQNSVFTMLILLLPLSWRQQDPVILFPLRFLSLEMDWWNTTSIGMLFFIAANYVKTEHLCKVFRLSGTCRSQNK
jgi:hypothetical protein